jgi:hypothetical protein
MIYITQYGFWWSTTPAGWRDIIEYALAHDGYDLDQMAKSLKNRPSTIRVDGNRRSGDFTYYSIRYPDDRIVRPLDWDRRDWEQALEELDQWERVIKE